MKKPFFIALLISLGACIKPKEIPDNVIAKDTMARILVDVHMAEARISVNNMSPDSSGVNYQTYKDEIYKKYHVSPARFDTSMKFYTENITHLDKIYEVVIDSLSMKEARKGK